MNHRLSFILLSVSAVWHPWAVLRAQQPTPPRPAAAPTVNIDLRDGRQVPATGFVMQADTLVATQQVGGQTGQIGYPLASIERVEFPKPPQLTSAMELLEQGRPADALKQIDPIVSYYSSLRAVPGNWWLPADLLRFDVLTALGRDRDADAVLSELGRVQNNAQLAEALRVRSAETSLSRNQSEKAGPIFDELIKTSTDAAILARAWVGKGQIFLAGQQYDAALLAYLRVPVLYPDNKFVMPAALLGSGRAFAGTNNLAKAHEMLKRLIDEYPASPLLAQARAELEKVDRQSSHSGS